MKELIEGSEFGKVLWSRGRYGKSVTEDYYNQRRSKKELAGGGILIDQGIHMLDLFLYLSGDYDIVKAEVSNLYWKMDVEDNAFVILKDSKSGGPENATSLISLHIRGIFVEVLDFGYASALSLCIVVVLGLIVGISYSLRRKRRSR